MSLLNLSLRPYRPERARSPLILEAEQAWAWLLLGWESVLNLRHHVDDRELELFHQLLMWKRPTCLVSELLWMENVSVSDAKGPGAEGATDSESAQQVCGPCLTPGYRETLPSGPRDPGVTHPLCLAAAGRLVPATPSGPAPSQSRALVRSQGSLLEATNSFPCITHVTSKRGRACE